MNRKPQPNTSVSWGTLRDIDVLEALLDILIEYRPKKYKNIIKEGQDILEKMRNENNHLNQEEISWFINETLWDACNSIAPKECYFGAHFGDSANFGFWKFDKDE